MWVSTIEVIQVINIIDHLRWVLIDLLQGRNNFFPKFILSLNIKSDVKQFITEYNENVMYIICY